MVRRRDGKVVQVENDWGGIMAVGGMIYMVHVEVTSRATEEALDLVAYNIAHRVALDRVALVVSALRGNVMNADSLEAVVIDRGGEGLVVVEVVADHAD